MRPGCLATQLWWKIALITRFIATLIGIRTAQRANIRCKAWKYMFHQRETLRNWILMLLGFPTVSHLITSFFMWMEMLFVWRLLFILAPSLYSLRVWGFSYAPMLSLLIDCLTTFHANHWLVRQHLTNHYRFFGEEESSLGLNITWLCF